MAIYNTLTTYLPTCIKQCRLNLVFGKFSNIIPGSVHVLHTLPEVAGMALGEANQGALVCMNIAQVSYDLKTLTSRAPSLCPNLKNFIAKLSAILIQYHIFGCIS